MNILTYQKHPRYFKKKKNIALSRKTQPLLPCTLYWRFSDMSPICDTTYGFLLTENWLDNKEDKTRALYLLSLGGTNLSRHEFKVRPLGKRPDRQDEDKTLESSVQMVGHHWKQAEKSKIWLFKIEKKKKEEEKRWWCTIIIIMAREFGILYIFFCHVPFNITPSHDN